MYKYYIVVTMLFGLSAGLVAHGLIGLTDTEKMINPGYVSASVFPKKAFPDSNKDYSFSPAQMTNSYLAPEATPSPTLVPEELSPTPLPDQPAAESTPGQI